MMRMNVSGLGGSWYGMVTADQYTDLLAIPEFVDYYKTGNESKLKEGIVGRILGIDIFSRSTDEGHAGILYNGNKPLSGDAEVKDVLLSGALFWNDKMVCRAEGKDEHGCQCECPRVTWVVRSLNRLPVSVPILSATTKKGVIVLLEDKA